MAYIDKEINCKDCGTAFIFTAGEQEFYAGKGLQNEPARCPRCRTARRTAKALEPEDGYVKYGVSLCKAPTAGLSSLSLSFSVVLFSTLPDSPCRLVPKSSPSSLVS